MTPERWQQVGDLYRSALEQPESERGAFLDRACGDDSTLRHEVESLLGYADRAEAFLEGPVLGPAASTLSLLDITQLQAGQRVGRYEVLKPLGAGGMGEVYLARDERLGRKVALKLLPPQLARDEERRARFEQEARAASALNHPNVCAVYEVGETDDGRHFIAMEYVDGHTLRERLTRGPVPLKEALQIAVQTAEALAAAHEAGIVHRDVKPENLMLRKDGYVKVLDFGLAKLAEQRAASSALAHAAVRTSTGVVMGTVSYMSPEQARGERVDHRSDIFSLGSILYEMVTGAAAFRRGSAVETMHAIIREDPPPMPESGVTVPEGLEAIVAHCLEKEPSARFQSARDVCFALEALSDLRLRGRRRSLAGARWLRVRWAVGVGAVFLVAALIAAGALLGKRVGLAGASSGANVPPSYKRLTYRRGQVREARFAPDGQTFVYNAAWNGRPNELFTQRFNSPEARPLGIADVSKLADVSSAGELVIILNNNATLAQVSLSGGAPRELVEGVLSAGWAPDGKTLMVVREFEGNFRIEFPIGHVLYQTRNTISGASLSPAGDRVAFSEGGSGPWRGSVAVVDLAGNKTTLTGEWSIVLTVTWSPKGDEVWFTAYEQSEETLHAVDLSGNVRILAQPPTGIQIQDVAPDGRVLLTRHDARLEMMALPPGESKERDFSWFDGSVPLGVSSDGRLVLFGEIKNGAGLNGATYVRATDGSPAVRLGEGHPKALAPDGSWAVSLLPGAAPRLVLIPTRAGESRELEAGPITLFHEVKWFPDGKTILVTGDEPGHPGRCYVQELAGGPPSPLLPDELEASWVVPGGAHSLGISPDGGSVLVKNRADGAWARYEIESGRIVPIPGLGAWERVHQWDADGRHLFVTGWFGFPGKVFRLDLVTGRRVPWKTIAPADMAGVYLGFNRLEIASGAEAYAYSYWRVLTDLYLAEGLK
jgi:tRNA A-37 threonylcarbamoyl transferase component Bud32/Tol biopolymer transport system component